MQVSHTWRQRVTLETEDLGALRHSDFLAAMQGFDWAAAGERMQVLASADEECCPAGFGAERTDGATLHLYSTDGQSFSGSVSVVRLKKVLGFIPSKSQDTSEIRQMTGEATRSLIQTFFTADANELGNLLGRLR